MRCRILLSFSDKTQNFFQALWCGQRSTVPIATWPGPLHARPFHSALASMPNTSCHVRAGAGSAHVMVLADTRLAVRQCAMRLDQPLDRSRKVGAIMLEQCDRKSIFT